MKKKDPRRQYHPIIKPKLTLGQKAADAVAEFVGSWVFISLLTIFIALWICLNIMMLIYRWDPYPFILLNFVLSCMATYQAPVILMSQNRQAQRDRLTAKYDYQVNRKAEREINNMQRDLDEIKALIRREGKLRNKS